MILEMINIAGVWVYEKDLSDFCTKNPEWSVRYYCYYQFGNGPWTKLTND